jgi:hypothetical protein
MTTPMGRKPRDSGVEDGIQWCTLDAPMYGAVNGYVLLPEGHPWRVADLAHQFAEVHGGITFGPERDGWFGFDTLHGGDIWPDIPAYLHTPRDDWDIEWTPEMVAEETRKLARQVAAALAEDVAMR